MLLGRQCPVVILLLLVPIVHGMSGHASQLHAMQSQRSTPGPHGHSIRGFHRMHPVVCRRGTKVQCSSPTGLPGLVPQALYCARRRHNAIPRDHADLGDSAAVTISTSEVGYLYLPFKLALR